jgi:hypothetical protein
MSVIISGKKEHFSGKEILFYKDFKSFYHLIHSVKVDNFSSIKISLLNFQSKFNPSGKESSLFSILKVSFLVLNIKL